MRANRFSSTCVTLFLIAAAAVWYFPGGAQAADAARPIRIGMMLSLSGPLSEVSGPSSVVAARMAVEDFGSTVLGRKIEIIAADDQNKPDIASSVVQGWIGRHEVDALVAGSGSAAALAVHELGRTYKIPVFIAGPANPAFTGSACSPMTIQFVWDSYGVATTIGRELMKRHIDTWFEIAPDNANGKALAKIFAAAVTKAGGKIVGSVVHATNIPDFSSFLLEAQASHAKGIAPFAPGLDLLNLLKQAHEYQMMGGPQTFAGATLTVTEIHALGLPIVHDMQLVAPFYHDYDDATRRWTARFAERTKSHLPTAFQAGAYSAVLHFLKAVRAAGTTDGPTVVAKMKALPINDFEMKNVTIRADGQTMRPLLLARVKKPSESKSAYDYLDIERVVPAAEAWRTLKESGCAFATKS